MEVGAFFVCGRMAKFRGIVQWVIDGDSTAKRFMNQSNVIWKKWQHGNIIVPSNKTLLLSIAIQYP